VLKYSLELSHGKWAHMVLTNITRSRENRQSSSNIFVDDEVPLRKENQIGKVHETDQTTLQMRWTVGQH
jgi:hypothetical protein